MELKKFLSSTQKQKIEKVNIKSTNFALMINTAKSDNPATITSPKLSEKNRKSASRDSSKRIEAEKVRTAIKEEHGLYFTIVSPMIGTFYRSPAPNEPPFISINDSVKASQTVCIIEAMKLMNEIESEVNGQIAEILVADGDIVDCGQALMRVKQG